MKNRLLTTVAVGITLLVAFAGAHAQDDRGYGPWRLGMSKSTVRQVAEFGPY